MRSRLERSSGCIEVMSNPKPAAMDCIILGEVLAEVEIVEPLPLDDHLQLLPGFRVVIRICIALPDQQPRDGGFSKVSVEFLE